MKFQVFSVWILHVPLQVFFFLKRFSLMNVHNRNKFEKMLYNRFRTKSRCKLCGSTCSNWITHIHAAISLLLNRGQHSVHIHAGRKVNAIALNTVRKCNKAYAGHVSQHILCKMWVPSNHQVKESILVPEAQYMLSW